MHTHVLTRALAALTLALPLVPSTARAQGIVVTGITTTDVALGPQTRVGVTAPSGGSYAGTPFNVTYDGLERRIATLTAGSDTYVPTLSGQAFARRNTAASSPPLLNGGFSAQFNMLPAGPVPTLGAARTVHGVYHNTMEALFTSRNIFTGTENLFVNESDTSGNVVANVERMDFIFSSPVTVASGQAFAVFERGGVGGRGGNGAFRIAAITALDANGEPSEYSSIIISVAQNSYSNSNLGAVGGPDRNYDVYRNPVLAGPPVSLGGELDFLNNAGIGPQGISGIVFPTTAFVSVAATVYGYSVMGADVTAVSGTDPALRRTDLINWNDSVVYPTNTPFGTVGNNDMDMVASGVTLFVIPEPSAYATLAGVLALALALRARRRAG